MRDFHGCVVLEAAAVEQVLALGVDPVGWEPFELNCLALGATASSGEKRVVAAPVVQVAGKWAKIAAAAVG